MPERAEVFLPHLVLGIVAPAAREAKIPDLKAPAEISSYLI